MDSEDDYHHWPSLKASGPNIEGYLRARLNEQFENLVMLSLCWLLGDFIALVRFVEWTWRRRILGHWCLTLRHQKTVLT